MLSAVRRDRNFPGHISSFHIYLGSILLRIHSLQSAFMVKGCFWPGLAFWQVRICRSGIRQPADKVLILLCLQSCFWSSFVNSSVRTWLFFSFLINESLWLFSDKWKIPPYSPPSQSSHSSGFSRGLKVEFPYWIPGGALVCLQMKCCIKL